MAIHQYYNIYHNIIISAPGEGRERSRRPCRIWRGRNEDEGEDEEEEVEENDEADKEEGVEEG